MILVISSVARRSRGPPAATATYSIPIPAKCRPRSPLPARARSSPPSPMPQAAQPAWAATNPQRRARVMFKFLELAAKEIRQPREAALVRAWQDARRCQGRHPARHRSRRIRLRHSASVERRVHRRRRPRHRPLFCPPAAWCRRRHHAVQFSGNDPAVESCTGDRLRQCLHPQAVRARSFGADAPRRTVDRGRPSCRDLQRHQWRQGSGRYAAQRSARQGDRLCGLVVDRASTSIRPAGARKTRAMLRRRQEPHDRHAGCRHGPGGRCADRRRLRLGRRALHGGLGRSPGRQENR